VAQALLTGRDAVPWGGLGLPTISNGVGSDIKSIGVIVFGVTTDVHRVRMVREASKSAADEQHMKHCVLKRLKGHYQQFS